METTDPITGQTLFFQSIGVLPKFQGKSLDELRFEDFHILAATAVTPFPAVPRTSFHSSAVVLPLSATFSQPWIPPAQVQRDPGRFFAPVFADFRVTNAVHEQSQPQQEAPAVSHGVVDPKSPWDEVPNIVVADILLLLISGPDPPTVAQVRDLMHFSQTCRRFRSLVCTTPELWFNIDVAALFRDISRSARCSRPHSLVWEKDPMNKIVRTPCRKLLDVPEICHCKVLSRFDHQSADLTISAISATPRLRKLEVYITRESDAEVVLRLIERLTDLEVLRIVSQDRGVDLTPTRWPLQLRSLCITCQNLQQLFEEFHPMPSLRSLRLFSTGTVPKSVFYACPNLRSLSVDCFGSFRQTSNGSEFDAVWESCGQLEKLVVEFRVGPSFGNFQRARCARSLRKLIITSRSGIPCNQLCQTFPNIERLSLRILKNFRQSPSDPNADFRGISALRHLVALSLSSSMVTSEVLSDIGHAEGTAPLRKLQLSNVTCDPSHFFGSRRCHSLQELTVEACNFPESSFEVLFTNARDSLTTFIVEGGKPTFRALLKCPHLSTLTLGVPVSAIEGYVETFAQIRKLTVNTTEMALRRDEASEPGYSYLSILFPGLVELTIMNLFSQLDSILSVIPSFPNLRVVRLPLTAARFASQAINQSRPDICIVPIKLD